MSRSKERKIKNLKSKPLWPRVVAMVFTDILVLVFTIFLSYLGILALINTHVLKNQKDCEKVIDVVNENWKGSDSEVLQTQLTTLQKYLDTIDDIYILNSDYKVVAQYGTETKIENIRGLNQYSMEWALEDGQIFRSRLSYDLEADLVSEGTKTLEKIGLKFGKALDFFSFSTNPDTLKWGNEIIDTGKQYVVYPCEIPGIYICIKNIYKINNFQAYFIGFLIWIFAGVFVFCLVFEIIRMISYVIDAGKFEIAISTDMVTGGRNKDWFVEKSKKRIKSRNRNFAVVQIRLEKYRNYCTSFGVKEGENLLEHIYNTMVRIVNRKEYVAHVEKSDFALLLEYENEDQLNDRIKYIVNNLVSIRKKQHLTFITGVAKVNSKTDDINFLLSASALALGKAADAKNLIVWFNDAMKEEQVWERRIEDDMEEALLQNEFQVYLQPKYSTKGEELAAAEALVRWVHPVIGFISPGKFIPIFENNGFILKLDDFMIESVSKLQAKWMAQGKKLFPISVNVSRAHFTKEDLAEHICAIVDKYKVPHEYVELELTESAFFDDKSILLNTVKKLKSFGFAISMDDFGAGYSSLNSLKEMPLDVIKLDAEFFRGIDDVNRANMIVENTIGLAKKLGMQIVAEGIETRDQVDFLANQNCDLIQGFYFSKPLSVADFEARAYPEEKSE